MSWQTHKIEELASSEKAALATGPFGSAVSSKHFRQDGVPMLRGINLSENVGTKLNESDLVFLETELAETFIRSTALRGDLIFTCWGSVGQIGLLGPDSRYEKYIVSNKQMKLTVDRSKVDPLFLYYNLSQPKMIFEVQSRAIGSTIPGFNLGQLKSLTVDIPSMDEQRSIAEVLGALDDKIAANTKLAATSAFLALSMFKQAVLTSSDEYVLSEITSLLSRGITPKYADSGDTMMILNQKCVRNQRVDLSRSRRTALAKVRPDKVLQPNDVLVNSTGQGTLGRVSRWTSNETTTVDSHITVVRFDIDKVDPIVAGVGLLGMQETIVEMGEGSTGQTELSRIELGKLRVRLPSEGAQLMLGHQLDSMAKMEKVHLDENITLAATRDALLPQLMSGKLRVREAEGIVSAAV